MRAVRQAVAVTVLFVCGCASASPGRAGDAAVIVAAPLTGAYAATGAAMRETVTEQQDNATVPVFEDDGCQAAKAVEAAQRIIAAKPAVVIGHPCSSAAIAAAPVYAQAQIPFISTGARHGDLTDKRAGPLVFRLGGRDDRQGEAAAQFLARVAGGRPIALLHDRTFAMSTLAANAMSALTGAEGLPAAKVATFSYVASELNYDALVAKVTAFAATADGVGAVFFAGYPSEAIVILRALRANGVTAPFLGSDALAMSDFSATLVTAGGVSVLVSTDADGPHAVAARTAAAVEIWREAAREDPADPGAALSERAHIARKLGPITFDSKGDARVPSYLVSTWRDGAWKPVAAAGETEKIPLP